MKKGVTMMLKAIIGVLLVVGGILVFFNVFGAVVGILFPSPDECRASENSFNLLNEFVDGIVDGEFDSNEVLFLKLQERCDVVSFDSVNLDVVKRPTQCVGRSCLCLCYREEDEDKLSEDDCRRYNFCQTFKGIDFKSISGPVYLEGQDGVLEVTLNKRNNIVEINLGAVHATSVGTKNTIKDLSYFFEEVLKKEGIYDVNLYLESGYLVLEKQENSLLISLYDDSHNLIDTKAIGFNGEIYYVTKVLEDTSCQDSYPFACFENNGKDYVASLEIYPRYYYFFEFTLPADVDDDYYGVRVEDRYVYYKNGNLYFLEVGDAKLLGDETLIGRPLYEEKEIDDRTLARLNSYSVYIDNKENEDLILALVMQESYGGVYYAVSPCGAVGVMQLMPPTATQYGVDYVYEGYKGSGCDNSYAEDLIAKRDHILDNGLLNEDQKREQLIALDQRFNVKSNMEAGEVYLNFLLERYNGDEELALAAYNWGEGRVDNNCDVDIGFASCKNVPEETANYVPLVLGYREFLKNA